MPNDTADLTIVLVHGAFADASSWNGVVERLQSSGLRVTAPPNPAARFRCGTRPGTAGRRRQSSRSTRRSSATRSPPTCRPSRPR